MQKLEWSKYGCFCYECDGVYELRHGKNVVFTSPNIEVVRWYCEKEFGV